VLAVAYPIGQTAAADASLQTPTGALESCVEIEYLHFTEAERSLLLTTRFRNTCDVDIPGGRVRILALDEAGELIEDGWSQIPELPAGDSGTDDTLFQRDLGGVASMAHADLAVWDR
jgi:hypothetical protein